MRGPANLEPTYRGDLLCSRAARHTVSVARYDEIADRLEAIGSDLDEASFDLLQQAAADGATQRPPADKTLMQARRAVEKAVQLLRSLDS